MKSPVPPVILGWMLRPRPSGTRRYVAGYLCVGAATVVATMIIAIFIRLAAHCTVDGFGCLALIFRGYLLGGVIGLLVLITGAIMTKLGLGYVLATAGSAVPIMVAGLLLDPFLAGALPIAVAILAAVPAIAARVTRPGADSPGIIRHDRDTARRTSPVPARRHLHPLPR